MLIDTHAHLNFKAFNKDLPDVIERAQKKGVEKIIIPGAKIDSSYEAVKIAATYPSCYAAVAIHPHHIQEFVELGTKKVKEELQLLCKNKKIVAIGEIGLDYYQYRNSPPVSISDKESQKELFLLQLQIAFDLDLPAIIHCRNAHDDLLDIIKQYNNKAKGVFHCFGGEEKHLQEVLKLGFYVGFDGNITYPENKNMKNLVKLTPLSKLLLETDSPYLTPLPFRGRRNEPAYITYITKEIAEIHQRSIEKIAEITSRNALNLFKI